MKVFHNALLVVFLGLLASGCMYPGGRPDYTGSGALGGAAAGAAIGGLATNSGQGALIGGAIGAIAGGLIGHGMDATQEARLMSEAPQTYERFQQDQPLSVDDVRALSRAGVGDDLVISQIRNSRTVYTLTTDEIIGLKNAGVSERVIDYMINTRTRTPSSEVAVSDRSARRASIPQTVVVAPGPDYVWVDGAWVWYGRHRAWHRDYWHRPYGPYRHGHRPWW